MSRYDAIINLPHHVSEKHTPMSMYKRAAQFSSFDALTGFDDCIDEETRITDSMRERTEDEAEELNAAVMRLLENEGSEVEVVYFKPDEKKAGGSYVTYKGVFRRFDRENQLLRFMDRASVPVKDILRITFL